MADGILPPVVLIAAPTGARKSTRMRTAAVAFVTAHPDQTAVIALPRHELGKEQIAMLMREHPNANIKAAIWRGRHADDPETPHPQHPGFMPMCWRSEEAEELEKALVNVESHLCKRGRGKKAIKCPFYHGRCGYQRQKLIAANIWFCAHESMVHAKPKALGDIGWLLIDESPLDAFTFGIETDDRIELALDALREPPPPGLSRSDAFFLREERERLYRALDKLTVPSNEHQGAAVSLRGLGYFAAWRTAGHNIVLEWKGKVEADVRPDMTEAQVSEALKAAEGNATVAKRVMLWQLVHDAVKLCPQLQVCRKGGGRWSLRWPGVDAVLCGRIQLHRGRDGSGRVIRMVGLRQLARGWRGVPILLCDASGDAELLQAIWPQLKAEPWPQLPRPASVRVTQVVDSAFAKSAIAVEGDDLETKARAARKMYAAVLHRALQYGGADVAVITYKSTRQWIERNCFVPEWLKLAHYGDVAGSNMFENVRALFEVGRPQPPPEAMARMAEALFERYVDEREYVLGRGLIPIEPTKDGHNLVEVMLHRHCHPKVHRLLRQAREWTLVQAEGRARAGLRDEKTPLDIHRWHDVPLPELGPVIMQRREEVMAGGLDALMLATAGAWLENIADAVRSYERQKLFTADGLKKSRQRGGVETFLIGTPIRDVPTPHVLKSPLVRVTYQRRGGGCKPTRAVFLKGVGDPRGWLEQRLGPLASFELGGGAA
jgi:hypothetical protein